MRIISYHNLNVNNQKDFERQICWLKDNWNIITPEDFVNIMEGKLKGSDKDVLITFDDGYKSILKPTNEVLNKYNIKALYFIIFNFCVLTNSNDSKNFIKKNIAEESKGVYGNSSFVNQINTELILDSNLQIADLKEIISSGHTIGSHSKSHLNLSKIQENDILYEEIINSGKKLKKLLNLDNIKHFSYPYGNDNSFNAECYKISKKYYKYIYSGVRGNNAFISNKFILRRDPISPSFSNKMLEIILLGGIDYYYYFSQKKIDNYINVN